VWEARLKIHKNRAILYLVDHYRPVSFYPRDTMPARLTSVCQKPVFCRSKWMKGIRLVFGTDATSPYHTLCCVMRKFSYLEYFFWNFIQTRIKGKVLPHLLPSAGPGADPGVQAVSPQVTWSHRPGRRLPLLSARPVVTFPAEEHHRPLAGTKLYCLVTDWSLKMCIHLLTFKIWILRFFN